MKKIYLSNDNGFTLIEILIYLGMLIGIGSVIVAFSFWLIRINALSRAREEVLNNSRRVIEIMSYELRQAQSIYAPTSRFDVHPGQLSFETLLNVPAGESKTYKDFYLSNGTLYLKEEGQEGVALTSNQVRISNLVFRHINAGNVPEGVEINLVVEYNNPGLRPELDISEAVSVFISLRAY